MTYNIMLICVGGMSTSLIVEKMKKHAIEKGIDAKIWATSITNYKHELDQTDIILLAPQARYMVNEIKKYATNIPVELIDMRVYGSVNGEAVLEQALKHLK